MQARTLLFLLGDANVARDKAPADDGGPQTKHFLSKAVHLHAESVCPAEAAAGPRRERAMFPPAFQFTPLRRPLPSSHTFVSRIGLVFSRRDEGLLIAPVRPAGVLIRARPPQSNDNKKS